MTPLIYEAVGYLASLLVAISLMMRSVLRLRIINLVGSACFVVYGLLIKSYPVAGMNAFIVLTNLYYLSQILRTRATFVGVKVEPDAPYLQAFLEFHRADIQQLFPGYSAPPSAQQQVYLILRDAMPIGLVVAERKQPDSLFVHIDYVIPGYRDFQPGKFFYTGYAATLKAEGIRRICTAAGSAQHQAYLAKMNFAPAGENQYCLTLA